jgi:hypothetical protein
MKKVQKRKSAGRVSTKNYGIGFVKKLYKSTKYNNTDHFDSLVQGAFIKFWYGGYDFPKVKQMTGKITKNMENGVECWTECGYFNVAFCRINRIFLPKTSTKLKETRVKSADGTSLVPLLDGAINKIKTKFINETAIKVDDKRIDLTTRFNRITKFQVGKEYVQLEIIDNKSKYIQISGSEIRNSKAKVNDKGKINTFSIINKIRQLIGD